MSKNILRATHYGKLEIGETTLSVAVLNNGQRVINYSSIFKAFGRTSRGSQGDSSRVHNMPAFLNAQNLQPFVGKGLTTVLKLVEYFDDKDNDFKGYDAIILPLLCKVYLDARSNNALKKQQLPQARASEILLLGLSNIGIISLVDEATGYQYDREAQALQKILKAYINEELLVWQKRFPDVFYKEIFRLNGWDFTVHDIKKRPGVIGHWTNQLIYKQLPKGVLQELKRKTPKDDAGKRKFRFHQLLTLDLGQPDLQRQLSSVITIMKLSKDWNDFTEKFNQLYGQTSLDFNEPIPSVDFNKTMRKIVSKKPMK